MINDLNETRTEVARLRVENTRLREALCEIRNHGRVCPEFETCTHPWCGDSYGAWQIADAALGAEPIDRHHPLTAARAWLAQRGAGLPEVWFLELSEALGVDTAQEAP